MEANKLDVVQVQQWLTAHLHEHYALYGEYTGVRSARKHIGWAVRGLPGGEAFRQQMNTIDDARRQADAVAAFFDDLAERHEKGQPVLGIHDVGSLDLAKKYGVVDQVVKEYEDLFAAGGLYASFVSKVEAS